MVAVAQTFVSGLQYYGKAMPLHDNDAAAEMLPFPRRAGDAVEVVVLFYREAGPVGRRKTHPPDYEVVFSPDAALLRHGPRSAADLGIAAPSARLPEYADRWRMDAVDEAQNKLFELAPTVWSAWRDGAQGEAVRDAAATYWKHHLVASTEHEGPWYEQAGAEFFRWLRTMVAATPTPGV